LETIYERSSTRFEESPHTQPYEATNEFVVEGEKDTV